MKIYIGTDHAGYELKETLKVYLSELGHEVEDKGAYELDMSDDYPDLITPVAKAVAEDKSSMGVVLGGSGQGEAMCANKIRGIRAFAFYGPVPAKNTVDALGRESTDAYEIVKLARMHNNANIISLGVRFITEDEAKEALKVFFETAASDEDRHLRRVVKLDQM